MVRESAHRADFGLQKGKLKFPGASVLALGLCISGTAVAQTSPAASTPNSSTAGTPAPIQEIVVTGSRVNVSGFNAPTPMAVVSNEALDKFQASNVADVLTKMPSFKATFNPASTGYRTQLPGANFADLYGLGANRTLVLLDGMRMVPQAPAASAGSVVAVDLNVIPSLMIDHVDVVTGGASAQWGSDAVAGVVNVFLKSKYKGIEIKGQTGISQYGDNETYRIGGLAGTDFADGRGNIVAGFDYSHDAGLGDVYTRDWSAKLYNIVSNPNWKTNGLPANLVLPNVVAKSTPGGVITGPANFSLANMQFLPGGALAPFELGEFPGALTMVGGDPNATAFTTNNSLANPVSRLSTYLRTQYDVSDALSLFVEASYAQVKSINIVNPPRALGAVIRRDNPYLSQQIVDAMDAAGISSFTINRLNYDLTGTGELANGVARGRTRTWHVALGAKGDLGGGWNWDAHVGFGRNRYRNATEHNQDKAKFAFATDAVLYNGQIVCRATVPGPFFDPAAAGCQPVNLVGGVGAPSVDAANYYLKTAYQYADYDQDSAAINLRGQPFSTWAGPVAIAAGFEYRREKEKVRVDPVSDAGGFLLNNATNLDGSFNVKEGYLEVLVPLARDLPMARSLDIDAAIRYASYSTAGDHTTWKIGVNYEPVEGLRFRATRSRDLRAPAIFELFGKGSVNQNTITVNGFTRNIPANVSIGNRDLDPEIADTVTAGAVFQPRFLPGFQASVDYYRVNLQGAITSVASSNVANLCNAGDEFFCSKFTFDADGAPTALNLPVLNAGFVKSDGFNVELAYRTELGSIPGSLSTDFNMTYVNHVKVNLGAGGDTVDHAGENGGNNNYSLPRAKFTFSSTYALGPASVTARVDFISAGTIDNSYNQGPSSTINDNSVPAIAYLSLYSSYDITENLQLFGSIQNLLNQDPPVDPIPGLFATSNGVYYDFVGRRFQVGASVKF